MLVFPTVSTLLPSNGRAGNDGRPALSKVFGLDQVVAAVRRAQKKIEAYASRCSEGDDGDEDPSVGGFNISQAVNYADESYVHVEW